MVTAGFVAPYLLDTTMRFVEAAASLPDTSLALITTEPVDRLPPQLRHRLAGVAQQLPQPGGDPLAQPGLGRVKVELGLVQPHDFSLHSLTERTRCILASLREARLSVSQRITPAGCPGSPAPTAPGPAPGRVRAGWRPG